jgi:hypothetical protein
MIYDDGENTPNRDLRSRIEHNYYYVPNLRLNKASNFEINLTKWSTLCLFVAFAHLCLLSQQSVGPFSKFIEHSSTTCSILPLRNLKQN